jgi:hypothetical protein
MVDQFTDPGNARLKYIVSKVPQVKEWAKTASLDVEYCANLDSNMFAWPEKRAFPINNREQTMLSYAYSKLDNNVPKHVRAEINKAASIYEIDITTLDKVASERSAPEYYLLPDKKRYKVASAEDVTHLESILLEKWATVPTSDLETMSSRLVKVAEALGIEVNPVFYKKAGKTLTDTKKFQEAVEVREHLATKAASSYASTYAKIAEAFNDMDAYISEPEYQCKLVRIISETDKVAGFTPNKYVPSPHDAVYNTELKIASFVKVGSVLANKDLLQSLPPSFWEDALGPDFAAEIAPQGKVVDPETLTVILKTIPADLKQHLEKQLAAYNR